jgi:methionyl-tRNA formyltransferase
MKIVFMGTPEFAVPCLDILVKNGYEVVGVVTATDKLGGRGNKQIIQSAVKQYAVENGLKVLQPEKLKNPDFIDELRSLKADLQIVVAFRMLPEIVWNMPRLGTMNLHGSILPKYRGAAPINWAVINGDSETGVTTFFLKHEIDTGDVLLVSKMSIGPEETVGEVHDRMMNIGAKAILASVKMIEQGGYKLLPQDNTIASHAPKIHTETCKIDFSKTVAEVHNFIRGMSPYPTAWTELDGLKLKIYKSKSEIQSEIQSDNRSYLNIKCSDGYIGVLDLQLEGKKRMDIRSFLNGYKLNL